MPEKVILCLCFLLAATMAASQDAPPSLPTQYSHTQLEAFNFADSEAARRSWRARDATAPVDIVQAGPRQALRLPCNFAETDIERASWDWRVNFDAADSTALQFRFFCEDPAPVAHFNLYLRSGDGWYRSVFSPGDARRWTTVRIDKSSVEIEGKPAGWSSIDVVRISAWRGADENTECYVADFGLVGGESSIAVVLNDSASSKATSEYTRTATRFLDELGLSYKVLSDWDLSAERLQETRLLILPYCPQLRPDAVAAIAVYLKHGGKLVSFYRLPSALFPEIGFLQGEYKEQEAPGEFASIRRVGTEVAGIPEVVAQATWNIWEVLPVAGESQVVAEWYDSAGRASGNAAILASKNCVHMTHVLLPDDHFRKRKMFLAMLGRFYPDVWRRAARGGLELAGRIDPFPNFETTRSGILKMLGAKANTVVQSNVDEAVASRDLADKATVAGEYIEVIDLISTIQTSMVRAFCAAQSPREDEFRAFWCHNPYGVPDMTWDEAVSTLERNGFTAIIPNMMWAGRAYYPSTVLPVAPQLKSRGDPLAQCLAACRKYGVQCHVWKVCWNTGGFASKDFIERMRSEQRLQVSSNGITNEQWLCPSHPANQQLEIDAMIEVATNYDIDGIHLDYIRYPGPTACFCDGCRSRFQQSTGIAIGNWPSDVLPKGEHSAKWTEFRQAQITAVVAAISLRVREVRPRIKISAAVFRNWLSDRNTVGQDWKAWCDSGYLDFVCPMDYTEDSGAFERLVKRQLDWAGDVPCYPGIGLSTWGDPADMVKLVEQINLTRRLNTGGFTVFNYDATAAREILPLSGLGLTRKKT